MIKPVRIVFMGTAAFAVPTLDILVKSGYDVAAVVTAPDKPAGRGKKIRHSPVKEYAMNNNLTVLQPIRLSDEAFVQRLRDLKPEIQVVVAFRMLPKAVWKIPPKGTLNLHASLLPQFRGAAPINHAIIQGSKVTGLTTFLIDKKIDTGRILKQIQTPIGESETAGELHDRLMIMGTELTLQTVRDLVSGKAKPISQDELISDEGMLLPAPKIFKADCQINWEMDTDTIFNLIRGLSPVPGAYTGLNFNDGSSKTLKVFRSEKVTVAPDLPPGAVKFGKNTFEVACKNGFIKLLEIQLEGKRKMQAFEFLRGFDTKNVIGTG